MNEFYLMLTGGVILGSLLWSYRRTRDPMSPLITFAPMLFYVYVYHPFVIMGSEGLNRFFPDPEDIEYALLVNLVSITAFCGGASYQRAKSGDIRRFQILEQDVSPRVRQRFFNLSVILGTMSFVSFWWLVFQSGGPMLMLKHPKPFFASASGYIGEMPMLTFPAIMLLAAAWQGRRLSLGRFLFALYIASPQISWAILGKRRGTIFLIAAALAAFWYLVRNKRPNWKVILGGVGILGLLLLFVTVNRRHGNSMNFGGNSQSRLSDALSGNTLKEGDEFVSATGMVLTSAYFNHHYWGKRFFAIFFIRPIPSFLWESKWKDFGLIGLQTAPGLGGMSIIQWRQVVGFEPTSGNAGGFVADAYLEWSWGGALACYALGFGFSWLWKRWVTRGGVWTVLYVEAMILTVFLPSQSLGAWGYRFALLAVPTALVFRYLLPKKSRGPFASSPSPLSIQTF